MIPRTNFNIPGLFRAAIGESATALSAWAYQNHLPDVSYYLAGLINPEFKKKRPSSEELLKYMKSLPAKTIDKASYHIDMEVKYEHIVQKFIIALLIANILF